MRDNRQTDWQAEALERHLEAAGTTPPPPAEEGATKGRKPCWPGGRRVEGR